MGHPLTCCIVYFVVTGYCLSSPWHTRGCSRCWSENVLKSKLQKQTCSKAYEHYFQANWIDPENSRRGTYIILLDREMWACTLAHQPWYWSTFVNLGLASSPPGTTGKDKKGKRTALFWLREDILPVWITDLFPRSLSLHFLSKHGPSWPLYVQTRSQNLKDRKLCVQQRMCITTT